MVDLEGELIAIEAKSGHRIISPSLANRNSGPVHNRQGNYLWVKR